MTLCRTCHKGLDPHRELKMWELLSATEQVDFIPDPSAELRRYQDGVKRHRELIGKLARKLDRGTRSKDK